MALRIWKKIETSEGFQHFKLFLRRVIRTEPSFTPDTSLAIDTYANWFVVPQAIHHGDRIYALGVGDDIDFELEVIRRHDAQVFAFDPTPSCVQWIQGLCLPSAFHFFPWAVSGSDGRIGFRPRPGRNGNPTSGMYAVAEPDESADDGITVESLTLPSIAKRLKHGHIDVLKMDIEGAEYDVVRGLVASELRPRQLLIEFHHRFAGFRKEDTIESVAQLRAEGYLLTHVSSTGREFSFVHRRVLDAD